MKRLMPLAAATLAAVTTVITVADPATASTPASTPAGSPTKIVSLSPSATETLYAIGAGPQVVAVDEYSTFPAETQQIRHDLSGYTPNIEAIASLAPDLVIHDGTTDLHDQLAALKIPDLIAAAPADLSGVFAQIEQIGAGTGHIAEAAELVSSMSTQINTILGRPADAPFTTTAGTAPAAAAAITYFHELDNTLYTVTSSTFIGSIYGLFGLHNIADDSGMDNPYPQLSAERVIAADPQIIFLADGGFGESAETVAARPGWADIAAVQHGHIVVLDADIASRWGPRVVSLVQLVADAVADVSTPVSA